MTIPRREILRYLGYRNAEAPEEITAAIDRLEARVLSVASPRTVKIRLRREQIPWGGSTVCKALSGCDEAVLFAATLGALLDRELSRAARENMGDAVIMQAVATALIEEVCDALQSDAAQEYGLFARPRISPGYGDFAIDAQVQITRMLDTARKIGLMLTDGLMLAPTKSVTALFGLSREEHLQKKKTCETCDQKNCAFRIQKNGENDSEDKK